MSTGQEQDEAMDLDCEERNAMEQMSGLSDKDIDTLLTPTDAEVEDAAIACAEGMMRDEALSEEVAEGAQEVCDHDWDNDGLDGGTTRCLKCGESFNSGVAQPDEDDDFLTEEVLNKIQEQEEQAKAANEADQAAEAMQEVAFNEDPATEICAHATLAPLHRENRIIRSKEFPEKVIGLAARTVFRCQDCGDVIANEWAPQAPLYMTIDGVITG